MLSLLALVVRAAELTVSDSETVTLTDPTSTIKYTGTKTHVVLTLSNGQLATLLAGQDLNIGTDTLVGGELVVFAAPKERLLLIKNPGQVSFIFRNLYDASSGLGAVEMTGKEGIYFSGSGNLSVQTCDDIPMRFKLWSDVWQFQQTELVMEAFYPLSLTSGTQLITLSEATEKKLYVQVFQSQLRVFNNVSTVFTESDSKIVVRVDPNFDGQIRLFMSNTSGLQTLCQVFNKTLLVGLKQAEKHDEYAEANFSVHSFYRYKYAYLVLETPGSAQLLQTTHTDSRPYSSTFAITFSILAGVIALGGALMFLTLALQYKSSREYKRMKKSGAFEKIK